MRNTHRQPTTSHLSGTYPFEDQILNCRFQSYHLTKRQTQDPVFVATSMLMVAFTRSRNPAGPLFIHNYCQAQVLLKFTKLLAFFTFRRRDDLEELNGPSFSPFSNSNWSNIASFSFSHCALSPLGLVSIQSFRPRK